MKRSLEDSVLRPYDLRLGQFLNSFSAWCQKNNIDTFYMTDQQVYDTINKYLTS